MSSVQYFLHSIQHINHSFVPVPHTFVLPKTYGEIFNLDTSNQYEQSIQMFFIIPLEIAIVYIIIYTIIILIYCCYGKPQCIAFNIKTYASNRRNSDDEELLVKKDGLKITLTPCAKTTRIILAIGIFILIAASIYCAILLDHTANIIGNNINQSYQPYKENIIYGNEINESLHASTIQCDIINIPQTNDIRNELIHSQQYLNKYLFEAQGIPSWGSTTDYLVFSHSFSQFVIYFGMLICVVLAVCFFMSMFSGTMIKFMSCLTLLCIITLLILFSLQFAFSINVSDACSDPNNAILQIANNKTDKDEFKTMQYYLYCGDSFNSLNNNLYNPLYDDFNNSYQQLLSLKQSIYNLSRNSLKEHSDDISLLIYDYNLTLIRMNKLNEGLQCNSLYTDKQIVVNSICIDGISQWFRVYMLQFGMVLLLLIRNCCLCCGLKYKYHHNRKRIINNHHHHHQHYGSMSSPSDNIINDKNSFSSYGLEIDQPPNDAKYVKYSINTPPVFTNKLDNSPSFGAGDIDDGITIYKYDYNKNQNIIKIYIRRENGKTEYIKMNISSHKTTTIHDLKQEIQIKWGYPVQTQKIIYNQRYLGCNHKFNEIDIKNGDIVYLKLEDDRYDDDNFTVEYNGYIELNSYVPKIRDDTEESESEGGHHHDGDHNDNDNDNDDESKNDDDDDDINDYWSLRIDEWCIHNVSDKIGQYNQIGIICYQYNGKVEWELNGIKCKSGDIILKNITSMKHCQYETMYKHIFGVKMDGKFIGNGFKLNKYGKIKLFSNQINRIGKIEMFWLEALINIYHQKGIKTVDIEKYQKQNSRYRYDIDKFNCDLCGIDEYIDKEPNVYPLLTEFK